MNKNTTLIASLIIAAGLVLGALIFAGAGGGGTGVRAGNSSAVHMEGNTQVVEVVAKGGYRPDVIIAKAGVPTVLRMRTQSTFDCSAAFVIPALGIRKMLPPSGVTEFTIPSQPAGSELQGLCGMGMYGVTMQFR